MMLDYKHANNGVYSDRVEESVCNIDNFIGGIIEQVDVDPSAPNYDEAKHSAQLAEIEASMRVLFARLNQL